MSNRNKIEKVKRETPLQGKEAYIAQLRAGNEVSFRSSGNSMTPRIKSGDKCRYVPIKSMDDFEIGDAVFCKVGKFIFTHLVTAKSGDEAQISNNHGHTNGWTNISNIYGKMVEVL